jgi:hypothetical protein
MNIQYNFELMANNPKAWLATPHLQGIDFD